MGLWVCGRCSTHMHMHVYMLNMIISIAKGCHHGGIPGGYLHLCMCTCSHTHTPIHPPQLGTPQITKNSISLEVIKIFQFCLKISNL